MSFPASLTTRTVMGRFVTYPDGVPACGTVRIILTDAMQGPTDGAFVAPFDRTFYFDASTNGQISVVLPSNNDPQWTPSTYRVIVTVEDKVILRDTFDVPYDSTDDLDLTNLVTLPPIVPGQSYILVASKGAPGGVATLGSDGKVPASQLPPVTDVVLDWAEVQNKPATFPPSSHTHDFTAITGKPATYPHDPIDWDEIQNKPDIDEGGPTAIADVTGLQAALDDLMPENGGDGFTLSNGSVVRRQSASRTDIGFSNFGAGSGYEVYSSTDPDRPGHVVMLFGGPVADGETPQFTAMYYDGEGVYIPVLVTSPDGATVTGDMLVTQKLTVNGNIELQGTIVGLSWEEIDNRPTTFAPSTHEHVLADVQGLVTALASKLPKSGAAIVDDIFLIRKGDLSSQLRFRSTGGAVDIEKSSGNVIISSWNSDFSGGQTNLQRWRDNGTTFGGRTEFSGDVWGSEQYIDGSTQTAKFVNLEVTGTVTGIGVGDVFDLTTLLDGKQNAGDYVTVEYLNNQDLVSYTTLTEELGNAIHAPVQTIYASPGTFSYADPGATCKYLDVTIIGPGGGGGSGRLGAAASVRAGGSGGGSGGYSRVTVPYSAVTFPVSVTLGSPGTGGAAITVSDTNGNAGGNGGGANFGAYLRVGQAGGGSGGTAGAGTGGFSSPGMTFGQTGASASATGAAGPSPTAFPSGPSAGGAGGGLTTGNAASAGGAGAAGMNPTAATGGVVGGASPANGQAQPANSCLPGSGGGGGASSVAGAAQAGANGGLYGAGGGGGGAATNGQTSGKGGDGAAGIVRVIAYF